VSCGTVVEENTIVSELGFDETSAGAAVVQGSFVAQGSSMSFNSTRSARIHSMRFQHVRI